VRPRDQHRGEPAREAKVDPDNVPGPAWQRRDIEILGECRQQLNREHRTGTQLRNAFEPRLALGIIVLVGEIGALRALQRGGISCEANAQDSERARSGGEGSGADC